MSSLLFASAWLILSVVAAVCAMVWLRPLMDSVLRGGDVAEERRRLGIVGSAMAAVLSSLVAAVAYLVLGLLVPSLVGWYANLIIDVLIAVPILAFGAMTMFARTGLKQLAPSWRVYAGYLWRVGALLAVCVVSPAALVNFGWTV